MIRDLPREEPRLLSSSQRTSAPPSTRRPVPEVRNATALLWAVAAAGRCWMSSGVAEPSRISLRFCRSCCTINWGLATILEAHLARCLYVTVLGIPPYRLVGLVLGRLSIELELGSQRALDYPMGRIRTGRLDLLDVGHELRQR